MDNEKRTNDNLDNEDLDLNNFSDNQDTMMFSWARKFGLLVFEIAKVVLISLAIILPIRMYLVQPFYVEGASMEPNFFQNEYLIINEISYRFEEPVRGEVIIFKNPKDTKTYFIKRVIGLPGETVEVQSGKVFINNKELKEEYIENFSTQSHEAQTLSETEYFLLGDNRINSYDSRTFGPVDKKFIIGKVWFRGWPINRVDSFNIPDYNIKDFNIPEYNNLTD